ncbi:glycoside hydrolase family 106 protein [Cenococcum geophilum 1.58]|uniref:glycoside hydrolase family 106 protein n=1 Tax=Cenococcum geophilum 1.58 TaxID=794803 RepID=UPI000DC85662|nr:glycoside hydrolase family 106 protein [Cenococcum geophilum 1.58]
MAARLYVNGNIRKATLEEDVEAMFEAGLGGAPISDVYAGIPQGSIEYESDEWLDLLVHTPFSRMGVYKDLFTFAYPAQPGEGVVFRDALVNLSLNGLFCRFVYRSRDERLFYGLSGCYLPNSGAPKNAFDGARNFPPSWTLQASNDTNTWTKISVSVSAPALRQMDAPSILTFSAVTAKYYCFVPTGPSWVTGIDISSSPWLPNWAVKAHGAPGTISFDPRSISNISNISSSVDPVQQSLISAPDDSGWTEHPYQLKAAADHLMTLSPNRFYLHEYAHQLVDSTFPGMTFGSFGSHFDRMNTWTKQSVGWSQHLVRSSLLLRNAVKVTEVACFVGEELSASLTASLAITYNSSYLVPLKYQASILSRANLLNMTAVNKRASYPSVSISKDRQQPFSTTLFKAFINMPYANVSSSFLILVWAKPEIAQFGTTGYLFYPSTASSYGSNHALTSIAMGWNGIKLERPPRRRPQRFTISGWTHICVVYNSNLLSLYINGELVATGLKSAYTVHPGVGTPNATTKMINRFEGDIAGLTVLSSALSAVDVTAIFSKVTSMPINSSWTVGFLAEHHSDFDVAHFSGTATYTASFALSSIDKPSSTRYLLNLGRVENIASINVTSVIRRGQNKLQVEVTNCWPNRLIGDENLPKEATYNSTIQDYAHGNRVTFSAWKHYNSTNLLFESGLLGPVTLTKATVVTVGV